MEFYRYRNKEGLLNEPYYNLARNLIDPNIAELFLRTQRPRCVEATGYQAEALAKAAEICLTDTQRRLYCGLRLRPFSERLKGKTQSNGEDGCFTSDGSGEGSPQRMSDQVLFGQVLIMTGELAAYIRLKKKYKNIHF